MCRNKFGINNVTVSSVAFADFASLRRQMLDRLQTLQLKMFLCVKNRSMCCLHGALSRFLLGGLNLEVDTALLESADDSVSSIVFCLKFKFRVSSVHLSSNEHISLTLICTFLYSFFLTPKLPLHSQCKVSQENRNWLYSGLMPVNQLI